MFTAAPVLLLLTPSSGAPTAPGAPILGGDQVEPAEGEIRITTQPPASDGGSAIIDYQLERSVGGASFVLLTTILAADLSEGYNDDQNAIGDSVVYRARARNAVGFGPYATAPEVTSQGPLAVGYADGYYAKHTRMKFRAGVNNLAIYSQLDNDATTEDQDNLQLAMDEADRYVDTRARVLGLTADDSASSGHMIGTDNVYFSRISDLASDIAVAFIYSARGFTGDQSNTVEGQMADMDKKAREELDEILDAARVTQATSAGSDGATVVMAACRPCEYRGPLHRWGW